MSIKRAKKEGPATLTVDKDDVAIHFTGDGTTIYMPDYVDFENEPPPKLPSHVRIAIMHLIALEHPEAMEEFVREMWNEIGGCTCPHCVANRSDEDTGQVEAALTAITIANNEPGEA